MGAPERITPERPEDSPDITAEPAIEPTYAEAGLPAHGGEPDTAATDAEAVGIGPDGAQPVETSEAAGTDGSGEKPAIGPVEGEDGPGEADAGTYDGPQLHLGETPPERESDIRLIIGANELFERAEKGDPRARDRLVESFMPLARKIARRYEGKAEPLEDLVQVAAVGLMKAIDRFDRSRGHAFTTFAVPTMVGEIKRHFRDRTWVVHVSRGVQERIHTIHKTMDMLSQEGRPATLRAVAEELKMPYEDVVEAWLAKEEGYRPASLDSPGEITSEGDSGTTLMDVTPGRQNEDTIIDQVTLNMEFRRILSVLSPRDKKIFMLRHLLGKTQREIAEVVGISQMHVSRTLRRAEERAGLVSPDDSDTPDTPA